MRRTDPEAEELAFPEPAELPAPAALVVQTLAPLVTERRLARLQHVSGGRTRRFVPILESLMDPHNGAAILRSADAFGLQEVHVIPSEHGFHAARNVAKGTERWLELRRHLAPEECVATLKERGYRVLFASMEGDATPSDLPRLMDEGPLAIAFGNERRGPSPALRAAADGGYRIPMRGFVESLNVSVAAAITFQAATAGRPSDLSEAEREELLARWLLASIKDGPRVLAERLATTPESEGG